MNKRSLFLEIQDEAVAALEESGVPFVVIKGCAASVYYPKPEYRRLGDIDILVHPTDHPRALEALRKAGFQGEFTGKLYNIGLYKDGYEVELHWLFTSRTAQGEISPMDQYLYSGFASIRWLTLKGHRFPALPVWQNGVVLLHHIRRHLNAGIGLRQVTDWMLYVKNEITDEVWSSGFQELMGRFGLDELAVTLTRVCQLYLGLDEEKITWCLGADAKLCGQLMEYLLQCGNFGRSREQKAANHVQTFMEIRGGIGGALKYLQKDGEQSWELLKKYPFLKPFAWIYRLCRSVYKLGKYKITPGKLILKNKRAKQVNKMLKKLKAV